MPVCYTLSGNLLRMNLEGAYAPEDIIKTFGAALNDPRLPENPRFLFDVTKSSELATRETEIIKSVARYFADNSNQVGNRCAIVAVTPIHYGLSRMAATISELHGAQVQVFANAEDAISWLGAEIEISADNIGKDPNHNGSL